MTELYPRPNEQRGGKGAVPVTNIDFFTRKSSLPTRSIIHCILFCLVQDTKVTFNRI